MISVVIALYNKERHIARAIQSVLGQTCGDFELVIVDDGSTDEGAKVVESFNDRRIRSIHQQNAGVSAARNRGVAEARADLIAFLDADDEWKPDYLEAIISLRERFPHAAAWTTTFDMVSPSGILQSWAGTIQILEGNSSEGIIDYFSRKGDPFYSSSITIQKDAFLSIGGFPVGFIRGEDNDTWLRLALKYPIAWSSFSKVIRYANADNRIYTNDYLLTGVRPEFESLMRHIDEQVGRKHVNEDIIRYVMSRHRTTLMNNLISGNRGAIKQIAADHRVIGYWIRGIAIEAMAYVPPLAYILLKKIKCKLYNRPYKTLPARNILKT